MLQFYFYDIQDSVPVNSSNKLKKSVYVLYFGPIIIFVLMYLEVEFSLLT